MCQQLSPDTKAALELRVLAGPQAGARAPLARGAAFRLWVTAPAAAAVEPAQPQDLALHSAGAAASLQIEWVSGTAAAAVPVLRVQVLQGELRCGAECVCAGQVADWPMRHPLDLDGVQLAWGPMAEAHWQVAAPAAPDPAPATATSPAPTSPAVRAKRGFGAERWLATAGVALALGSAGLMALAQLADTGRQETAASPLALATRALQASDFNSLSLQKANDGQLELSGRLATQAQRAHLDQWLQQKGLKPRLAVRVDEQLARDVTDVFRLHGIVAKAQVLENGAVQVQAQERDAGKLQRAEQAARRDVAGLSTLQVDNQPRGRANVRAALPDDPGKRVTAVVADTDLPYLVTADGSRYFVGALLPSGHRVMHIAESAVTIERDGQLSKLTL
jgi:type III secretion protein D